MGLSISKEIKIIMAFTVKLGSVAHSIPQKANCVGSCGIYAIRHGGYSKTNRALYSEGANTCLLVGLKAGKKNNCLLHIAPEHQSVGSIEKELISCINKIQEQSTNIKDKVCAILFGGRELLNSDPEAVGSFDIYNTVANVLDKLGISFSMICGKKKGASTDNMFMGLNDIAIWNKDLKNLKLPENASQDEIATALSERYEFVEFSPDVPIEINKE
jgi:hypothetical protein